MSYRASPGRYQNVTSTTAVTFSTRNLRTVVLNKETVGTVTLYDNSAASGTDLIGTIAIGAPEQSLDYDCAPTSGFVTIKLSSASDDVTVVCD